MDDFQYNDILNYEYPNPEIEKDFPDKIIRAAQFAPFAALTGHDDAIAETARLTDSKTELDEYQKAELNRKLITLSEHINDEISASITYFEADGKKKGGKYVTKTGKVKKVREFEQDVIFEDGTRIFIDDITAVECAETDITEE